MRGFNCTGSFLLFSLKSTSLLSLSFRQRRIQIHLRVAMFCSHSKYIISDLGVNLRPLDSRNNQLNLSRNILRVGKRN